MTDVHVDLWAATAAASPVIGLSHSVITGALYNATARMHQKLNPNAVDLGRAVDGWPEEARKVYRRLRAFSDVSMGCLAACIVVMAWALTTLGYQSRSPVMDAPLARGLCVAAVSVAMVGTLVLGICLAREAPVVAKHSARQPADETMDSLGG